MKHCSQCGSDMQDGDRFCMNCGTEYVENDVTKGTVLTDHGSPQQPDGQTVVESFPPVIAPLAAQPSVTPSRPKGGSGLKTKLILGAILATILAAGGFWGWTTYGTEAQVEKKLDLAVKYLSDNNYEQAILAFNDAIKIDRKEVKGYQGLAKTYTLQGNYDSAKETYEKGITAVITPQNKRILQLGLAGMYMDQNRLTDAEQAYSQIMNASPNCLEAYWGLAMVFNQQGNSSKAEAILRQAVEKNPKEYRGYNTLALFLAQNNKLDEALNYIAQSLAMELNQQEVYLVLDAMYQNKWAELRSKTAGISDQTIAAMLEFYSYYAAGDSTNAINTYQNKMANQNANQKAKILTAIAMVKNGDKTSAEAHIKQLNISKVNDWLLSDLGRYYLATGDKTNAREYAIKALQAEPTNLDAIALLQAMNANDPDAKFYVAQALLFDWKPIQRADQQLLNWNEPSNKNITDANQDIDTANSKAIVNATDETQKDLLNRADAAYNAKIQQYKNTSSYYNKSLRKYENKFLYYVKYDIDKNGIPELIVKTGTGNSDMMNYVYTFQNGALIDVGSFSGFSQSIYGVSGQNAILSVMCHMGVEKVDKLVLENEKIISNRILDKDVGHGDYDQFPNEIKMITIFP